MKNKIILLIPYFGVFPEWFPLFFETLKRNPKLNFMFFTDCETYSYSTPNVEFKKMSFEEYVKNAQKIISVPINIPNAYKICDLRPLFGLIHNKEIESYDYYGWMDIDLLLGDVLTFYTPEILKRHTIFSTHADRISGHFALFKNSEDNRKKYLKIYKWEEALNNPEFVGIDENGITRAYTEDIFDKVNDKFSIDLTNPISRWFKNRKARKMFMVEQYTTPFLPKPWIDGSLNSDQPSNWTYQNGEIRNDRDDRNFMYLHFMNFKNSQWRHDGTKAPWEGKKNICHTREEDFIQGIDISENGIYPSKKS